MPQITCTEIIPHLKYIHHIYEIIAARHWSQKCIKGHRLSFMWLISFKPLKYCRKCMVFHYKIGERQCKCVVLQRSSWFSLWQVILNNCQIYSWAVHDSFTKWQVFPVCWPFLWWKAALSSLLLKKKKFQKKSHLILPLKKQENFLTAVEKETAFQNSVYGLNILKKDTWEHFHEYAALLQ